MKTPPTSTAAARAAFFTEEHLRRRREAMAQYTCWVGVDDSDPKSPAGHAQGVRDSTWLTRQSKQTHWKHAMNISPQEVVDVLTAAKVKKWVLMGLHGYVGYLPQPRATQDVDVMVPQQQRKKAVKAIREAWPDLLMKPHSEVVRFLDPQDCDPDGNHKPVVDLMLPWGKFQQTILDEFVVVDRETKHRIPTLEAALVSKYAAMISLFRSRRKKEHDAGDFRGMVSANHAHIQRDKLRRLGAEVWDGGGQEIEQFVEIALRDEPFPV